MIYSVIRIQRDAVAIGASLTLDDPLLVVQRHVFDALLGDPAMDGGMLFARVRVSTQREQLRVYFFIIDNKSSCSETHHVSKAARHGRQSKASSWSLTTIASVLGGGGLSPAGGWTRRGRRETNEKKKSKAKAEGKGKGTRGETAMGGGRCGGRLLTLCGREHDPRSQLLPPGSSDAQAIHT
jgi:hypothetical protein